MSSIEQFITPARSNGPALRVWTPDAQQFKPSDPLPLTVTELFTQRLLPMLEELGRARSTIADYHCHLRRWRAFWSCPRSHDRPATRIGNPQLKTPGDEPPAESITADDLLAWRRWLPECDELKEGKPPSTRTLNKHLGSIKTVLDCGGIRPKVAHLPDRGTPEKLYLTREQVGALYQHCEAADWPALDWLPPADWWRTALVVWYNYGLRTQELAAYEADHRPLTVGQFLWAAESPRDDGHAHCEHGWFHYVPQKQERFKPEPLVLPLNAHVAAHVRYALRRRTAEPGEPLLPAPRCNRDFYATWDRIVAAAGVRPKQSLDGRERVFRPKHLRKSATTLLNQHRAGIAPLIVGHADRNDVSATHYDNAEQRVVEAVLSFPQPEEFDAIFHRGEQQMRLF